MEAGMARLRVTPLVAWQIYEIIRLRRTFARKSCKFYVDAGVLHVVEPELKQKSQESVSRMK